MKKMHKVLVVSLLAILAGCSSSKCHRGSISDVNDQAQTQGLGNDDGFGTNGINGCTISVGNQTYYFEYNSSDVSAHDRACIEVQAKYLTNHPKATVLLEGYTDPRGSR